MTTPPTRVLTQLMENQSNCVELHCYWERAICVIEVFVFVFPPKQVRKLMVSQIKPLRIFMNVLVPTGVCCLGNFGLAFSFSRKCCKMLTLTWLLIYWLLWGNKLNSPLLSLVI